MFGGNDRELLHQILRELGELRERVTGQQHAIDQIRQDTTAALNTGLAENRSVVRDGLQRHHDTIGDPLSRISTELVALRASINDLGRSKTAPTIETVGAPNAAGDEKPAVTDGELLTAAAGISAAKLQMHRDAWAFLVEHAAGDRHFHVPGKVGEEDGLTEVHVSGPSIVAALTSLHRVSSSASDAGTRAIASHLHARLKETVQAVIDDLHRGNDANPVTIVIDDRAKPGDPKK